MSGRGNSTQRETALRLARQALDLYAASFAAANIREPNGLIEKGKVVIPDRSYFRERQARAIARLVESGVITP